MVGLRIVDVPQFMRARRAALLDLMMRDPYFDQAQADRRATKAEMRPGATAEERSAAIRHRLARWCRQYRHLLRENNRAAQGGLL